MFCCSSNKKKYMKKPTFLTESDNPLSENLILKEKIGESNHPVYKVFSKQHHKEMAMKAFIYQPSKVHPLFNKECLVSQLHHPNIISVYDCQPRNTLKMYGGLPSDQNLSYILMEIAPHGDFASLLNDGKFPKDEILTRTYFHQLIEGLEYIHKKGISHLDLKPGNLLLGENFELKITDFDLSSTKKDCPVVGSGTRDYRAPELRFGTSYPMAADVFSAAIILFNFRYGLIPYSEDFPVINGHKFLEMILDSDESFWNAYGKSLKKSFNFSDDFKELFFGMTRRNPAKRFQIEQIKRSKWYNGPVYTKEELEKVMKHVKFSNRLFRYFALRKINKEVKRRAMSE